MECNYYGNTDIGLHRKNNEDAFIVQELSHGHILAVVADGVGSNPGGGIASSIACKCISSYFNGIDIDSGQNSVDLLKRAMCYANNTIITAQQTMSEYREMASTVTAVLLNLHKMELTIGHVGDSRLYRCQSGNLTALTTDDIAYSGHKLSKWTGKLFLNYDIDYFHVETLPVTAPCSFLLCSDGLHGIVSHETIKTVTSDDLLSPYDKVMSLIRAANASGGYDNVTAIIVELK